MSWLSAIRRLSRLAPSCLSSLQLKTDDRDGVPLFATRVRSRALRPEQRHHLGFKLRQIDGWLRVPAVPLQDAIPIDDERDRDPP